ncbi:MAG: hypothetical protein ACOH2F_00725 [Cellulomonas sp.]
MSERLEMAKALYLERCSGVPGGPTWDQLSAFTRNEYVRVALDEAARNLIEEIEGWRNGAA